MAIRVPPTSSSSRPKTHASFVETVAVTKDPSFIGSDCCFCFPNCDWDFPAFAFLSDETNTYKNDRIDFIVNVPVNGTVEGTLIELSQDGTIIQSISIVDNTYGLLFNTGTLKANVWGFILEWSKVADVENFGRWKFNTVVKNSTGGEIFNNDSVCFRLQSYDCQTAHRTVKIKTEQSGYFEGGFDYTGIVFTESFAGGLGQVQKNSWPQEMRLFGRFFREGRDLEIDNIVTEERGQQLIQSKTIKRYVLKLDTIPAELSNRLIDDMLQAPDIRISDYQVSPVELFDGVRVTLTDLNDPDQFTQNKNEFYEIGFLEWQQDNVHRFK